MATAGSGIVGFVSEGVSDDPRVANSTALICNGEERSYGDLALAIDTMRHVVARRCGLGAVVAVIGDTSIEFIETVLGVIAAGAVVLPLSPQYPLAERQRACSLAEPALVITLPDLAAAEQEACAALGREHLAWADYAIASAAIQGPGEPDASVDSVAIDPDSPALLLFTSGTAGKPRLAELTHSNVEASIRSTIDHSAELGEAADVVLGVMPLTHVLGLVTVLGVSLALKATLVLVPQPTVESVVAAVDERQVTLLVAPPVFWHRLAAASPDAKALASVKLAISGAAPLSGSLAKQVTATVGLTLRQGYGLTEASPALTSSVGLAAPATSVGRPVPGVELRLVDEFGDDALIGDVGEVWARGANIFAGYRGDPAATANVLDPQGWLRTGDLAVVDDKGYLYIVGRSKDQIICSGFNVHPTEVEERLLSDDRVQAVAVVGAPDREFGEVVVAWIVPSVAMIDEAEQRSLLAAELRDHCRVSLAGYKVPSRFEFVDELPRGLGGKLRRRALRSP